MSFINFSSCKCIRVERRHPNFSFYTLITISLLNSFLNLNVFFDMPFFRPPVLCMIFCFRMHFVKLYSAGFKSITIFSILSVGFI